jgi:two-component system, sensor histidine kinase and response regulator
MNAYMNKPVSSEQLQLEVRRCLEGRERAEPATIGSPDSSSGAARRVNWFQPDQPEYQNLIKRLRELFLQDTPARLIASRQAISEGDVTKLKRQAHSLKGSCAQIEALVMATISADLENCAKNSSFELAEALLGELEQEFERLRAAWTEPEAERR